MDGEKLTLYPALVLPYSSDELAPILAPAKLGCGGGIILSNWLGISSPPTIRLPSINNPLFSG